MFEIDPLLVRKGRRAIKLGLNLSAMVFEQLLMDHHHPFERGLVIRVKHQRRLCRLFALHVIIPAPFARIANRIAQYLAAATHAHPVSIGKPFIDGFFNRFCCGELLQSLGRKTKEGGMRHRLCDFALMHLALAHQRPVTKSDRHCMGQRIFAG